MLSWLKRQEQRLEAGNLTISCSRRSPMHNTVGYGSCHRLACCHSAATERTRTRWGRDTAPELTLGGSLPRAEPHGAPLPQHSQCCNGAPFPFPVLFFCRVRVFNSILRCFADYSGTYLRHTNLLPFPFSSCAQ